MGQVKFTEREMTVGVDAAAQQLHVAGRPPWRRGKATQDWKELDAMARYQHRATAGEMVLPTLVALPERPTVGATPAFSAEEYAEAAEAGARALVAARREQAWEKLSEKQRNRMVAATSAITRAAVEAMPLRQDPDALIVPDYFE